MWGLVVLHATTLLKLRPTLLNVQTPAELQSGRIPDVSHIKVFGCQVWVPVAEPKRHTIGAHQEEGIYIGFDSPAIIRYLVPATCILLKARFANCRFIESIFPKLYKSEPNTSLVFSTPEILTLNPDPPTGLSETEVTKLLNLKSLAEKVPDGFATGDRIIRHPIPGTGNSLPQKRAAPAQPAKQAKKATPAKTPTKPTAKPKTPKTKTTKMKIHYTAESLDSDPGTLEEAQSRADWPMWQHALEVEYNSLRKHKVFGPTVNDLDKHPIGHRLIFTRKFDASGTVTRYKVRLVAQGFSQRPGIDFDQTYSPVMDTISFRFLLALTVQLSLHIYLLDVVTACLHGVLDTKLFIVPPPGYMRSIPAAIPSKHTSLQIMKALYGLKQAGRTWYHHLCNYLIPKGFVHNPTLPCIFTLVIQLDLS